MTDKQPFLLVDGVKVLRQNKLVVEVPYLELVRGDVLTVAGPNGAGKSTFLQAIAGLINCSSGKIVLNHDTTNSKHNSIRKQCALVLQESLLLHTTVRENVGIGLNFRRLEKDEIRIRVDHWLEVFGLTHLAKRQAFQLSGGEAQRVSLSRAFATGADLLLLDEPFSALDAPTRASLLNDFQSILKESDQTAILITHDLDEALMLGDQIAIFIGGKLRQFGMPQQVFENPADSEVADFVGVENIIPGTIFTQKDGLVEVRAGDFLLDAVSDLSAGKQVYLCVRPEDITIIFDGEKKPSSARNSIHCRVDQVQPKSPLARITLDCGFTRLVSLVTRASALDMGLTSGMAVIATFKATATHLIQR
jgi:tungstate transport system ATP-binding protein